MQTPFFGIGAMRAGTSWLSQILADHPDCGMSPVKEMHFFDVRYNIAGRDFMRNRVKQFERMVHTAGVRWNAGIDRLPQWTGENSIIRKKNRKRREFAKIDYDSDTSAEPTGHDKSKTAFDDAIKERYDRIAAFAECITVQDIDAYKEFLLRFGGECAAFGEITPAYALLPSAAFKEMITLFPAAKFIFIMRDPIDRLWSQIRYGDGKARKSGKASEDLDAAFQKVLCDPQSVGRSNYKKTIETLEAEVPASQILYLFYEDMIDTDNGPAEIRRIENALGLKPMEIPSDLFETSTNASPKSQISEACVAAGLECFAPVYDFVSERFGSPKHWRSPV
jgi:hypothetical protein